MSARDLHNLEALAAQPGAMPGADRYVCICVYVYMYVCMYMYTCMCMSVYVCMYVCISRTARCHARRGQVHPIHINGFLSHSPYI
jgi:hypothetical protein